ncbi:MAG: hypothetical protein HFE81_01505 [Bacilli bacterium]|nr:hypothetical protein [Bacilli bacterium]
MRIGIDLDDTICQTTEIVQNRLKRYATEEKMNPLDIINDDFLKHSFFSIYLEDIYLNVDVKKDAINVLKRLRSRGNEIYVVTARRSDYVPSVTDVIKITERWLNENNIEVDGIITAAYGETKADVCKRYNIDIMIDDDPYNYKKIVSSGTKCLLFDDKERYDLKNNYVTSWLEIEKYIERNR